MSRSTVLQRCVKNPASPKSGCGINFRQAEPLLFSEALDHQQLIAGFDFIAV